MNTKGFYEKWSDKEIAEHTGQFGVLILFNIHLIAKEAELMIHGNITDDQAGELKVLITLFFGGTALSALLGAQVNKFAQRWYNKYVLKKKARVINFSKRKRV